MGEVVALPDMAGPISPPEPLKRSHKLSSFDSGEPDLDDWLTHRAVRNEVRRGSRTYVVCNGQLVVGFYCLSAGAVAHDAATPSMRRNMPNPIPVMVLGRLAVRKESAGQGIGSGLLKDAILRTYQAADIGGMTALLVHALHDRAAEFYLKHGFRRSPVSALTLMLSLGEIQLP